MYDWNHLSLSVTGPTQPILRRGRGLDLTQLHFSAQTKTFEHEGQNATKITSALADMHSISWASDVDFGKDIMFVLGCRHQNRLVVAE